MSGTPQPKAPATPTEIEAAKSGVKKIANSARRAIQVIAGLLALSFAFLTLSQEQVAEGINQAEPGLIYKIGLFIYYTCWVFGARFDVDIEEQVYAFDHQHGRLDWKTLGVILLFSAAMLGFVGLHVYGTELMFAAALCAFVAANYLGWRTVVRRVTPIIDDSRGFLQRHGDHYGLVKLGMVEDYMTGRWQAVRFMAMAAMAVGIAIASIAITYSGLAARFSATLVLGLEAEKLAQLLPAFLFVIYVLIAEAWMYLKRANVLVCLRAMDQLAPSYRLVPIADGVDGPRG